MTNKVFYEEMRPSEFLEKLNEFPVAYLPMGTMEWHGRHLPLGSDGIQSRGVFERLAKKIGGIVFPMLFVGPDNKSQRDGVDYYGMDCHSFENGQYQRLYGSCYYMEEEQFESLLHTIVKNMARVGFKAVVAHGHGPSNKAFRKLKQEFREKYGVETFTLWDIGYEGENGIQSDHAASNETSLVMAIRPDLVDMSEIEDFDVLEAIWGHDPRISASDKFGFELIDMNIEKTSKAIIDVMDSINWEKQSIQLHDVRNMIELYWEP